MRRSANVFAPLLAATAVALATGCHKQQQAEMQRCVDEKNQVVDPKFCSNLPPGAQQPLAGDERTGGGYYGPGNVFYPHYYRNYYGGMGGYALGSMVSGGGYAPQTGHSYSSSSGRATSSSGTSRGGFGSSFSSSSHGSSSSGS